MKSSANLPYMYRSHKSVIILDLTGTFAWLSGFSVKLSIHSDVWCPEIGGLIPKLRTPVFAGDMSRMDDLSQHPKAFVVVALDPHQSLLLHSDAMLSFGGRSKPMQRSTRTFTVIYVSANVTPNEQVNNVHTRIAWHSASSIQIARYKTTLNEMLADVNLPSCTADCIDVFCTAHQQNMIRYLDNINRDLLHDSTASYLYISTADVKKTVQSSGAALELMEQHYNVKAHHMKVIQ
ncbi:hypothetical protein CAPTEDRAFT_212220 [Capitella teleta]|uniref:Uncharacterized protein n=1 Tax=Capitella teleta TaxID=283909 RepID=R7URN1_CAPTE|nr:hypothetical protein CAPTEDRAFT_212220 [Capitella teleta]|eukprot:ELU06552.1 hypothetical protein CAPTEDRAFT_212220 [Capitella teleta]